MSLAPFFDPPAGETTATLVVALAIGIAFGWALERGGLGSARKLAAQFHLRDFTVVKVMFSAILTAMLGLYWLARVGVLDATRIYVPPTILGAQVAGGVLFGVGFVVAGLCPGTACVAGASGRLDGLSAVLGLFAGTAVFEAARPRFSAVIDAGDRGALRLPELLGTSEGVVVAAIALGALLVFRLAERLEASRATTGAPVARSTLRRPLALAAGVLAIGAALPASASEGTMDVAGIAAAIEREEDHVTAIELARWIRDDKPGLRVVDVRPESAWAALNVPGSTHASLEQLVREAPRAGEVLVLYSEGGAHAAQGWVLLRARGHREVYVLRGGLYEWITQILEATLPADADSATRSAWPEVASLSRYFGGQPRRLDGAASTLVPLPSGRAPIEDRARDGDERDAVRRVRKRGC